MPCCFSSALARPQRLLAPCLKPFLFALATLFFLPVGCDSESSPTGPGPTQSINLEAPEVQTLVTQAVEQAERLQEKIVVAVADREGNVLGVFKMNNAAADAGEAIAKARTAAYLSSNQNGFTTVTACFITRSHFPPGVANTPAGPLFGVPFSNLPGGDIQPNGSGLAGAPGGAPIFKNGLLAGGLGISGASTTPSSLENFLNSCAVVFNDEIIALGAIIGFAAPADKRGDNIFIDGIRFLYSNAATPAGNFTLSFGDLAGRGQIDPNYPIVASPPPKFPVEGEINLGVIAGVSYDFRIRGGVLLSAEDVRTIIQNAARQADRTRAAIRRPIGVPARVFVSVADIDGAILGIWRTPEATLFSFDVSAQKARTALAFSDPGNVEFGQRIRTLLGVPVSQDLAVTTRALGFLSQRFYPPGIDRDSLGIPLEPGPFFVDRGDNFDFYFQLESGLKPHGNGLTVFPGGIPLYKNGQLAGAIGISGDGVDQDDLIAFAGTRGFEPPESIRCDKIFYKNARLPFVKFPRQPELP